MVNPVGQRVVVTWTCWPLLMKLWACFRAIIIKIWNLQLVFEINLKKAEDNSKYLTFEQKETWLRECYFTCLSDVDSLAVKSTPKFLITEQNIASSIPSETKDDSISHFSKCPTTSVYVEQMYQSSLEAVWLRQKQRRKSVEGGGQGGQMNENRDFNTRECCLFPMSNHMSTLLFF